MEEQLKAFKKRIQLLEAKMEYQKENSAAMSQILRDMGHDIDAMIETSNQVQQRNEERFERIEKHVGL